MILEQIKAVLESTGLPVVYRAWQENAAPPLPYICYYVTGTNNFGADNRVYNKTINVNVELYSALKDVQSEEKIEDALSSIYWNKTETFIDSEKCYQILYEIEV